jgi:hypothetical protein
LLSCFVAGLLLLGPLLLLPEVRKFGIGRFLANGPSSLEAWVGETVAFSNTIPAFVSLAFVVLALAMLGHRLFWPFMERPLYKLATKAGAQNKFFVAVGLALVGLAGWPLLDLLKKIGEIGG